MAIAFTYTEATNTAVVTGGTSGTPAVFADFVTADRAGTATLLVATAGLSPTLALTYQIRPVEDTALLITFTIAAKSVHTDYIFITGTDWRGAAQTESIDVSAGNGVYASTKYFRTITNIDCSDGAGGGGTQWADGTVAVTQPQWGVIWDYGNGQYRTDSLFNIGDASTETHFKSTRENVFFPLTSGANILNVTTNANLYMGEKGTSGTTSRGSEFVFNSGNQWGTIVALTGKCLLYSSCLRNNDTYDGSITITHTDSEFVDFIFEGWMRITTYSGSESTYLNVRFARNNRSWLIRAAVVASNVRSGDFANYAIGFNYAPVNSRVTSFEANNDQSKPTEMLAEITNDNFIINSDWGWTFKADAFTADLYRQYLVNIHVADKDGANLLGVTVLCEDTGDTQAFSVSTDANGDIAEQTVSYKRYYLDGTVQNETYSPHKFTLSKAGYETLVLDNITVDAPIDWHLELQPAGGAGAQVKHIGIGVQI